MATKKGVCAVFGYGPGLSAAVARKWAAEGYAVALLARTAQKVADGAAAIGGDHVKGYACDVTNPDEIKATVTAIRGELGPIDCLVYNAGNGVWKSWNEIPYDDFIAAHKTNVAGLLQACQSVVPGMLERGQGGQVLITGATASLRGKPITAGFAPHKAAQRILAQSLARDLGPKGIHVAYFIIDGGIDTAYSGNAAKIDPDAIAETYWHVAQQPTSCWSFETEVRPSVENW